MDLIMYVNVVRDEGNYFIIILTYFFIYVKKRLQSGID